jgi:hypothetical protein
MLDALERFDREGGQSTARRRTTPPLKNAHLEETNRRMDSTDWPEAQVRQARVNSRSEADLAIDLFEAPAAPEPAGPGMGRRTADALKSGAGFLSTAARSVPRAYHRWQQRRRQALIRTRSLQQSPPRSRARATRTTYGWQELAVALLAVGAFAEAGWVGLQLTRPQEPAPGGAVPVVDTGAAPVVAARAPAAKETRRIGTSGPRPSRPVVKAQESSEPAATDRKAAVPSAVATPPDREANVAATAATPIVTSGPDSRPGRAAAALPSGTVNINAVPWASVFIDGKPVGDTPLGNIAVSAGTHDVIFKHPELGQRTVKVVVLSGNAARVSADLRK